MIIGATYYVLSVLLQICFCFLFELYFLQLVDIILDLFMLYQGCRDDHKAQRLLLCNVPKVSEINNIFISQNLFSSPRMSYMLSLNA